MNIGDIKKELQRLGISTNTPGLLGDDRYEELKFRLEKAQASAEFENSLHSSAKQKSSEGNTNDEEFKNLNFELLTIGELRSRLTSLGISTNTPGLSGQERFEALKKRLIEAICSQQNDEEDEDEEISTHEDQNVTFPTETATQPSQNSRRPPSAPPVDESPIIPQSTEEIEELTDEQAIKLVSIPQSEISELKKQQKRINNKRSLYIASQFSGSSQDEQLKDYNSELNNIESDLSRCRGAEQRGEKTMYVKELKTDLEEIFIHSSFSLDQFNVETLQVINVLERLKTQLKELIKERRNEIRIQAEKSSDFGLAVEEKLQYEINRAVMINNRINRARQKLSLGGSVEKKSNQIGLKSESQDKQSTTKHSTSSLPSVKPSPPPQQKTAIVGEKKSTTPVKVETLPDITPDRHSGEKFHLRESFGFRSEFLGKDLNFDHSPSLSREQSSTKQENAEASSMKNLDYFLDSKLKDSLAIMKAESKDWNDVVLKASPQQKEDHHHKVDSEEEEDEDEDEEEGKYEREAHEDEEDQNFAITNDDVEEVFRSKSISSSNLQRMQTDSRSTSGVNTSPLSGKQFSPMTEKGSQSSIPTLPSIEKGYFTFSQSNDSTDEYFTRDLSNTNGILTEKQQILRLRKYAKKLENFDDYQAAEVLYERALEIEPTDIVTLQLFAIFLQQKKGELSRAEAFFNRALQTCLPNLHLNISTPNKKKMLMKQSSYLRLLHENGDNDSPNNNLPHQHHHRHHSDQLNVVDGYKLSDVIHLLTSFSNFMLKSKGDIEAAYLLLEKSMLLAPEQASTLAHYAHFLAQHQSEEFLNSFYLPDYLNQILLQQKQKLEENSLPKPPTIPPPQNENEFNLMKEEEKKMKKMKRKEERFQKIDILFRYALKYQPGHVTYMMWYGKFLKKCNKLGPAELLYKSALEFSKGNKKVEPTAICNYATFLLKKRKNYVKAEELFLEGLENFPNHKGLRKNFGALIKILEKQKEKELNGVADEEEEEEGDDEEGEGEDSEEDEDDRRGGRHRRRGSGSKRGNDSQRDTEGEETEEDDEEDEEDDEDDDEDNHRHKKAGSKSRHQLKSPPPRPPKHLPAETRLMLLPTSPDRQKRGTKRASRVQQSLLTKLPEHVDSTELKADFIMRMMNQAFQKK